MSDSTKQRSYLFYGHRSISPSTCPFQFHFVQAGVALGSLLLAITTYSQPVTKIDDGLTADDAVQMVYNSTLDEFDAIYSKVDPNDPSSPDISSRIVTRRSEARFHQGRGEPDTGGVVPRYVEDGRPPQWSRGEIYGIEDLPISSTLLTSLVAAEDGALQVTYVNHSATQTLNYAVKDGSWTVYRTFPSNDMSRGSALTLDSQGRPYVAFISTQTLGLAGPLSPSTPTSTPTLTPIPGLPPKYAPDRNTFTVGINYPWIAHSHDYGENKWGHDGLSTGGWTYQIYSGSLGFTDARPCSDAAYGGQQSLCIQADLVGNSEKKNGEVYIDLQNHGTKGVIIPWDLTGVTLGARYHLPPGSAGNQAARNGVQLFAKSEGWCSFYSVLNNINPVCETDWCQLTANLSGPAGWADPCFDPSKIIAVGFKMGINPNSNDVVGTVFLDNYVIDTQPAVTFDFERLEIDRDFEDISDTISNWDRKGVRVFIFGNGAASPEFAPDGSVAGLEESFFEDFDVLVQTAEQYGLLLVPVLLDYGWLNEAELVGDVRVGGHSDVIRDPAKRQTFLDNALRPLIQRYCGRTDVFWAWDIINEPEWAITDLPTSYVEPRSGRRQASDPVTSVQMKDFVEACALVIHEVCPSQSVTVGSARLKWLREWQNRNMDIYQFHWYDPFASEEPLPWPPACTLGLDKPVFIGEVPTKDTVHPPGDFLDAACQGGYEGLLYWSYRSKVWLQTSISCVPT